MIASSLPTYSFVRMESVQVKWYRKSIETRTDDKNPRMSQHVIAGIGLGLSMLLKRYKKRLTFPSMSFLSFVSKSQGSSSLILDADFMNIPQVQELTQSSIAFMTSLP